MERLTSISKTSGMRTKIKGMGLDKGEYLHWQGNGLQTNVVTFRDPLA
jgi:hypothetical protein